MSGWCRVLMFRCESKAPINNVCGKQLPSRCSNSVQFSLTSFAIVAHRWSGAYVDAKSNYHQPQLYP